MNSILASQGHILVHCLLSRKLIIALAADLTHAGSLFPPNYTLEKKWRRSLGFFKVIPTLHAPWCQMGNGCSTRQTSVQPGLNWEKTLCAPSKQSCWRKGRCNATMTSHTLLFAGYSLTFWGEAWSLIWATRIKVMLLFQTLFWHILSQRDFSGGNHEGSGKICCSRPMSSVRKDQMVSQRNSILEVKSGSSQLRSSNEQGHD